MNRVHTISLGSIEETGAEHPQRDTVLLCGEHWIVLLPENENSCAPSTHKVADIRAEEAAHPGLSWWRAGVLRLLAEHGR